MARMSIDDSFLRDPRVARLGEMYGWSVRETRGCLLDVYALCYDRIRDIVDVRDVEMAAAKPGFAAAMVECDLAEWTTHRDRSGSGLIRIKGATERIRYLIRMREAGKEGGIKSGASRRSLASQKLKPGFAKAEASPNPPDPVPDPSPVPDLVPPQDPDLFRTPASSGEPVPTRSPKVSPKASRRPPRRPLPPDWQPRAREIGIAEKAGLDVSEQADRFRSHALMNGRTLVDWDEAFKNWLTSPYQKQGQARAERQNPVDAWFESERERKRNEEAQMRIIDVDADPRRRS